ncbi:hypothetical protein [Paenibacillus sp.]|uniref:hypothetical protein n=1 Tax=Paenibacillus sp. TaxID=58172 RepID=UPI002D22FDDD|nr:hypothetical protein [Paenibacillus sp.]HZG56290.1 hypothetical protein [Paenibacillus sp.]
MKGRWTGVSGMIGGVAAIFTGISFAMTHGSTTANRNDAWLGVDAVVYSQFLFIPPLFLFVALLGYEEIYKRAGTAGRIGLRLAQASCLLQSISFILQTNVVNPLTDWRSPIVIGGWLLFLTTVVTFAIGMLIWGAALAAKRLATRAERALFPAIGALTVAVQLLEFWITGTSDGGLLWEVAIGAKQIPLGLAWIALGWIGWAKRAAAARSGGGRAREA